MITVNRLGNAWANITDPKTGEAINLHLDSLKQVVDDPLNPTQFVITFSHYRRKAYGEDEVMKPTDAEIKGATKFVASDGSNEMVLLMNFSYGSNATTLFDTIIYTLFQIVLGNHDHMAYSDYVAYNKTHPRYGKTYLAKEDATSPTGRVAVWNVHYVRTYGVVDGLFSITSAKAEYRFGYMGGQEVTPGGIYNFPASFKLTRSIEGTDFIDVLSNLLDAAAVSEDRATTEPYWVRT